MTTNTQSSVERFMQFVKKQPNGCWRWTGATHRKYGSYSPGKKICGSQRAHRVAFVLLVGPIPSGLYICHRCDNPPCVNPAHLFLGTQLDNIRDAKAKGRLRGGSGGRSGMGARGEAGGLAKMTNKTVAQAVEMVRSGHTHGDVAKHFGVDRKCISFITNGKTWTHLGLDLSGIDHSKSARRRGEVSR